MSALIKDSEPKVFEINVPAPESVDMYTQTVENLVRSMGKAKSPRIALRLIGGPVVPAGCTAKDLQRFELALAKLQKRNELIIALLDGPLCDLSLSLALACDIRLATTSTKLASAESLTAYTPLPVWWLASLALHTGVLPAQQMLWRTQQTSASDLKACGVFHSVCASSGELMACATGLAVPTTTPLALLRRVVYQGFSISGNDVIGHSLAVSSLGIADAVTRAASMLAPLPSLVPLNFELTRRADAWVLSMTAEIERVALDELAHCMSSLNKSLAKLANEGGQLPPCLVIRLLVEPQHARLPMPTQLLELNTGAVHFNMKLVKWLTKLEKTLTALATLPLATVCHLVGSGVVCATALQIAFACDVRAMQPGVSMDLSAGAGVLPGTLAFSLSKHIGASAAMSMMAQSTPVDAETARKLGAVQVVGEDFDCSQMAHAPAGGSLLLCRYLLHDAVWTSPLDSLQSKLAVWQMGTSEKERDGAVTSEQFEQLAEFFPDQFIMPTETWQWKLSWSRAIASEDATSMQPLAAAPAAMPVSAGGAATVTSSVSDGVLTLALSGAVVTDAVIDAIGSLLRVDGGTDSKLAGLAEGMSHGAPRLVAFEMASSSCSLVLAKGDDSIAARWASLLERLQTSAYPTVAVLHGPLNVLGLELALACSHRIAATADISLSMVGWHRTMVPGARAWQLARSAGLSNLMWLLLAETCASLEQLTAWGVIGGPVLSPEARAVHLSSLSKASSAALFLSQAGSPSMLASALARLEKPSAADEGTASAAADKGAEGETAAEATSGTMVTSTVSGEAMSEAMMARAAQAMGLPANLGKTDSAVVGSWLREMAAMTEAAETRRRTQWLFMRLPQLEPESSLPLLQQHFATTSLTLADPAPSPLTQLTARIDPEALAVPSLKVSRQGGVVQVTISRASHANAYDSSMMNALERLIPTLTAQRVLAVIFHSSDTRFFCSGADLERVTNPRAMDALELQSQRVFELLSKAPFVSIAVVEGAAVAGGFEWALACDVRFVGPSARFWLPETKLGLVPAAGGCTRLSAIVGAARAKQVILFEERIDANRAMDWGVAQKLCDNPLQAAMELAQKLGSEQALARTLAKTLIDARVGAGGGHEESLRCERIAEGLLYEAKHKPRAVICGIGTAAPEERYTQKEVANLLQVNDPRLRAIYSAAHIESRRLAEIGSEQAKGTTQGQLLNKHVRWAKQLAAVAIPAACAAAGITLEDVGFLVVCTTTGFTSPGLSAHVANHLRLVSHIQRADIVGMGCHAGLNAMAAAAHWANDNPGQYALMFACEIVSAGYMWDHTKPDIAIALTNSLFGDGSAAAVLMSPTPDKPISSTPEAPRPALYGFESLLLPDSLDSLCYNWLDDYHKFSFTISPQVPYLMGLKIPGMVHRLLDKNRLKREDVAHWVVHSGGKKVLDCVMYSLGLSKHAIRHSLNSLRAMGNMSSGSFLWAYDALLREKIAKPGEFGMFITMGPGAGVECALWRFL